MKPRNLLLLLVLAVVLGVGGIWLGTARHSPAPPAGEGSPALPGLAARLEKAASLVITRDGRTLTLQRDGDTWRIAEKAGYPAEPEALHALLSGLAGLRLVEPRTADPALYARLGVGDPPADKDATLVRVLDAAQAPLAALILGHRRSAPSGAPGEQLYVRIPGQPTSWLAEGKVEASADPTLWTGRDLTNIPPDRMQDATLQAGGNTLAFTRADGHWRLTAPAEHGPLDDAKVQDVARAFEYLVFMDVTRAADQPGTPIGDSVFHTTDGLTLTAHVSRAGQATWVRFSAAGKDQAAAEAATLSRLFDGWAYQVGDWKRTALAPTLADLAAPPPKTDQGMPEHAPPEHAPPEHAPPGRPQPEPSAPAGPGTPP